MGSDVLSMYCDPGYLYSSLYILMKTLSQYQNIGLVKLIYFSMNYDTGKKNNPANPCKMFEWIGVLILETHVDFGSCFLYQINPQREVPRILLFLDRQEWFRISLTFYGSVWYSVNIIRIACIGQQIRHGDRKSWIIFRIR